LKGGIVVLRLAGWVVRVSLRNDDYHPLSGTSEKNPVSILLVTLSLYLVNVIPTISGE
jgi:hypothetical protein